MNNKKISVNAVLNIIKQCCNIIIPLATYPYVTRILGAENLGKYSFADSVISMAMIFASLGIPTYALREGARIRNDKTKISIFASQIFSFNIIIMACTVVLLYIAVLFVPKLQEDDVLIYILGINIITNVLGRDWVNNIYEDFLYITLRYILFQGLAAMLIFVLIRNSSDYITYTWIMLLANSGGYVLNIFYTRKHIPFKLTYKINLKKHIKPILYLFGVSLAIQIYVKSDIMILGFFCNNKEVGVYTLASRIYTIIKALLNAVIMVAIPRVSNYLGTGQNVKYNELLNKLKNSLYIMIFPCVTGLFSESTNVLRLIGGSEYTSGSISLKILCIALAFAVLGCFYAQGVLVPNRRDKYFFIATIVSAIENIVLNIILIPYVGMIGATVTTAIAELIVVLVCMFYSKGFIENKYRSDMTSIIIGCFIIAFICYGLNALNFNYILELGLAILISCISYITVLCLLKNKMMLQCLAAISKWRKK